MESWREGSNAPSGRNLLQMKKGWGQATGYDMIWYDMKDYINVRPKADKKPA